jgi:protein-S-isoprenylcysteine O-methyltransferase Ste14
MPIVAGFCGLYMLLYTLLFLMQPEVQNAYLPISTLQDDRIAMTGIVLMPIGALIMIISQLQLGASYRLNLPDAKTRLVTNGIYALSRNPLYMGLYIMFFAVWLMIPSWIYLFCLMFFVVNYHFKITVLEEPYLQTTFAEDYSDYCQKVNRYF